MELCRWSSAPLYQNPKKPNLLLSPQHQLPHSPPSTQNEDEILTVFRPFARECLGELICKLQLQEISSQTMLEQASSGLLKLRYTHFGLISC